MALSRPVEDMEGESLLRPGGIADRARARQGQTRYLDGLNAEQRGRSRRSRVRCWCWPAPAPARRAC